MSSKLAFKSVVAFGLAMLAGHFIFTGFSHRGTSPTVALVGTSKAADPAQLTISGGAYHPEINLHPPVAKIDRDFKLNGSVWENRNARMTTGISADYRGGITHVVPHHMGGKVEWKPSGLELRQDMDVVTEVRPAISEAHVEDFGGIKHVVYPSTYESTDEHLYVRAEGAIEHDIVLKHQPLNLTETLGLAYSGYLQIGGGLTMWDGDKEIVSDYKTRNGILFKNKLGNAVFNLRAPVAYDASVTMKNGGLDVEQQAQPSKQNCATGCEYQLTFESGKVKLAVVTSGRWLLAPERAYPVTIDPNFGPNGLADGNPPIYVGAVGTGNLIPAYSGGTPIILGKTLGTFCGGKADNGFGVIPMPFDFTFYPANTPAFTAYYSPTAGVSLLNATGNAPGIYPGPNSITGEPQAALFVHIDGWASFDPPGVGPYCDEIPCDPAESPCQDSPTQGNAFAALPSGSYPNGAMYALWNDLRFSNDPTSGVYYEIGGVAPNRSLIIEWQKMAYVRDSNPNDVISFNLILYECQGVIEVIIGDLTQGDKFFGDSSIGIESPDGSRAVVYDVYAAPAVNAGGATPIDGLDVAFSTSPLGTVSTQTTNTMGCVPLNACFLATVNTTIPPCAQAVGGVSIPPTFSFHWRFGDSSEAFTPNVCHIYSTPQIYAPILIVTDVATGTQATYKNNLAVTVCDIPPVQISATPQGGTAPLTVKITALSTTPYVLSVPPPNPASNPPGSLIPTISMFDTANTAIVISKLGDQNQPGVSIPYQTVLGGTLSTVTTQATQQTSVDTISTQVTFDTPGTYQVQGVVPGTSFGLNTVGRGTIYVDVVDPNSAVANNVIITSSSFHIDWFGKIPNALGVMPNPADDTITLTGYINLVGLDLSSIAGQQVTVALNAYNPIFQGILDTNGNAVQGDASTGKTGAFSVSMPSGKFTCTVKGDFAVSLGLASQNITTLLTGNYRIQIGNLFNSPGTSITYGYSSNAGKQAKGNYTYGKFFNTGTFYFGPIPGAPNGQGKPGSNEVLVSGGFIVTAADFKLQGDLVNATITGLLSRAGGDTLRPSATSDVVLKVGNFTETLNFSATPTFKTTGKSPTQRFSFKSKGGTHIQMLSWSNLAGNFQVVTTNMPNALVGIDPTKAKQPIQLLFSVTPDSNQQFIGTTTFDIFKVSDTEFKH